MPLDLLYLDSQIAVVDKPAGMLVHPGREPEPTENIAMKTLRDQLRQHVYPVHRLDRPTSGVLLFVLDQTLVTHLRNQFDEQAVTKIYTAVVLGKTPEQWTSLEPIQKKDSEPFREAETHFTRARTCTIEANTFSVIDAEPKSGRFHQIRKHLAATENPIVGDYLYGDIETMERIATLIEQPRLMLHARELHFTHPTEGVTRRVKSPLPERFSPFIPAGK